MRLTTGTGVEIDDPTPQQLREVLSALPSDGDNFAIYERDSMSYVQVAGCVAGGFLVEYQLGDTANHFRAIDRAVALADVVEIMASFAAGDDRFLEMQTWELDRAVGGGGRGGCGGPAAAMLLLGLMAIATCMVAA
jgi:hypothetical protein